MSSEKPDQQELDPPPPALDMATLGYVYAHLSARAAELRATGQRTPGTAKGSFYEDRADEAECCADEVRAMVERAAEKGLREMYRPSGYPPGWPACPGCGLPALDGHITCGLAACDEGGRRG